MTHSKRPSFGTSKQHIDIRLDGLFGELGKALGEAIERLEDGVGEVRHAHDIETGKGPIRAEAGIRVRMGGKEFETQTAPVQKAAKSKEEQRSQTPVRPISAMIFDEPDLWSLSADLPGVSEDELSLSVTEGVLTITAEAAGRKYSGEFDIPPDVTEDMITISLNNGILDLTVPRATGERA